jgi:hypothetical protein
MERATAERALGYLIQANGALNEAYRTLDRASDSREVHVLKDRVAMLIALIGTGLYKPMYHGHPELCPESMKFMLDYPLRPDIDWPLGGHPLE